MLQTRLIRDYSFADVLSAGCEARNVELAAFTQTPESIVRRRLG